MGAEYRALGGDHGEIVHRQSLLAAVEAEHLAQDAEFEGVHVVEQQGGHILQHAPSVAVIRCSMTVLPLPRSAGTGESRDMNTFLNYLGIAFVFALFLAPVLVGIARERRIDHAAAGSGTGAERRTPQTADAARPVRAARRPYVRSWARI